MGQRGSGDFSIGSSHWPGISKLIEECGEVIQVAGKLLGSAGDVDHWDGTNLKERLEEEVADVMAAIAFVIHRNDLDINRILERKERKSKLFDRWHREGDNND